MEQILIINNKLYVFPLEEFYIVRCIGKNSKGNRCKNPVAHVDLFYTDKDVSVSDSRWVWASAIKPDIYDNFLTQNCNYHLEGVDNYTQAEYRLFDLEVDRDLTIPKFAILIVDGIEKQVKAIPYGHGNFMWG